MSTLLASARRKPRMEVPQRAMMFNASGADVLDLQVMLRDAGLYEGDLDGYFGNATRVSVSLFQDRFGVFADGHWSEATIAAANGLLDHNGCVDSAVLCGSKPSSSTIPPKPE